MKKRIKRILIGVISFILVAILVVGFVFRKEIATVTSLKKNSEYPFYEMKYKADYGMKQFMKQGAATDQELTNLITKTVLKGLPIKANPDGACSTMQLYNATDSAMIGQYAGDVALAAVSLSFFLIRLVIGLFIGFSAGATVIIAQFIAALLVFLQLIYSKEIYGVNVRSIRIEKKLVPEILSMGLPSGLQSMIVALSNVMVQSYINLEGKNMMAGFGIFNKIDGVIMLPLSAIALALTTYTAQNYGAKNQERIKQGIKAMLFLQAISWVIGSVICILFGRGICELFSKEAQVIDAAMLTMRYLIPLYWAMGVGYSMTCILRGVGKSKEASILFILAMCVERQIWILLLKKFDFGIGAVLSSYPFSWAMTIVGSGLYVVYLKKKENIFA